MVATMPVIAISKASTCEPYRAFTKSAGVMYPCTRETDQSRSSGRKTSGYMMTVYGSAKKPVAPAPKMSAGTATKV
jgi:hypothetical protein